MDVGVVSRFLVALAAVTTVQPRRQIDVVFEGRAMSRARTDSAAREVRAIWAPYGVDVRVAAVGTPARLDAITLHVTLAEQNDPRLSREALGSINFHHGTPVPPIVMYPVRIEEQLPFPITR